jgi:hypothetical protein
LHHCAVLQLGREPDFGIDQPERGRGEIQAGDGAGCPCCENAMAFRIEWNTRIGCDVAGAAEVLQQRSADLGFKKKEV